MIDLHCHIGRIKSDELNEQYNIPEDAGADFLLNTLNKIDEVHKMFTTPYATPQIGYANSLEWLLSEVDPYNELFPVPVIHPQSDITDKFLERIDPSEVTGIKIHCGSFEYSYSLKDHSLLKPLFYFAEKNDLILFIHTDQNSCFAHELIPLIEEFQLRVVLLHCCRKEGVKLTRYESVFLETSGCKSKDIVFTLDNAPTRVVFGSDYPFYDYNSSLNKVQKYIQQIEENEKTLLKPLF